MSGGPTPRIMRRVNGGGRLATRSMREVVTGAFSAWLGDSDWTPWTSFLMALRAEPMTRRERQVYEACTGRKELPSQPFQEAWVVVGRRGRKSAVASLL